MLTVVPDVHSPRECPAEAPVWTLRLTAEYVPRLDSSQVALWMLTRFQAINGLGQWNGGGNYFNVSPVH